MYKSWIKRFLDIVIVISALLLIWPIFLLTSLLLLIFNRGAGVFFVQDRPGVDGKIFKILKFKTMTDERGEDGRLLPDAQRMIPVGRFVRSTSLDEIPQLLNVLKGDMSLIGPRPLVPIYLELLNDQQLRRHEIRPGITGWAQVHGRSHCKLSKKFEYDVWYVDNCSFLLDLKIIWMTVINVIRRKDIGEGAAQMKDIDDLGFRERIRELKASGKY